MPAWLVQPNPGPSSGHVHLPHLHTSVCSFLIGIQIGISLMAYSLNCVKHKPKLSNIHREEMGELVEVPYSLGYVCVRPRTQ